MEIALVRIIGSMELCLDQMPRNFSFLHGHDFRLKIISGGPFLININKWDTLPSVKLQMCIFRVLLHYSISIWLRFGHIRTP